MSTFTLLISFFTRNASSLFFVKGLTAEPTQMHMALKPEHYLLILACDGNGVLFFMR